MTGNTILITGGTSGIGRALAEAFHARGNKVIVTGRRQDALDDVVRGRTGLRGIALDVDDPEALTRFADQMGDEYPDLNVLIANAGISRTEDWTADRLDLTAARAMVRTNILGVIETVAAMLPLLRGQSQATIIATSSGLAFVPRSTHPTYCASKAFLHSWLQSLRTQLRDTAVEVLELAPPYVQTELSGPAQATDPNAMPLDAYIDEVMCNLDVGGTEDGEILVDRTRPLRNAERDAVYATTYAALNG